MPARRFWAMERSINRIQAERDLRAINVAIAAANKKGLEQITQQLAQEIGETCEVVRSQFVKPESGVSEKFASLMRR